MRLPDDGRPEHVPEHRQFGVARRGRLRRDAVDRAVALVKPDRALVVDRRARQVALLVLDDGEPRDALGERRAGRELVLEICPTSNLNTRVVSGWDEFRWIFDTLRRNEVRFTINTDGPEMLKTYIRDEMATLGRLGILTVEDQELAAATSLAASFVPNVSDVPPPVIQPARRDVVEREEA